MASILQAEDIAAIDHYVTSTPVKTPAGQAAKEAWISWHDGTSLLERYFDRATFDRARNLRLAFELANATSEQERADIMSRATTGLSAEELQGEADRRDRQGRYSEISGGSSQLRRLAWTSAIAVGLVVLAKRALLR